MSSPLPPFSLESARAKVLSAEVAWNSRDPDRIVLAYTEDTEWRNRSEFLKGRSAIHAFLTRKWQRELDYKLRKDLFAFHENRIAVRFEYEYRLTSGDWFRAYGNENWIFAPDGRMSHRFASINDLPIQASDRYL